MLPLPDLVRISVRQVVRQHRRYLGVVLSIAFGTAGLIVVLTTGRDVKVNLNRDLDLLGGVTMLKVYLKPLPGGSDQIPFRAATVDALRALPNVRDLTVATPREYYAYSVIGARKAEFMLMGVDECFWSVNSFRPSAGRFFEPGDHQERRRVCVLGRGLAERLFPGEDPVGQVLPIEKELYRIVGLLDGPSVGDRDQWAFLPLATAQARTSFLAPLNRIYLRCRTWDDVDSVAASIPEAVGRYQSTNDLVVEVARAALKQVRHTSWWVYLFIIVAIMATLILGGFGIWNGMMAAVQARTREIGLKKAMGAEDHDILKQFLSEAICLGVCSAVIGVLAGYAAVSSIAALLDTPPPRSFLLVSIGLSLSLSVVIGLIAGYYPARRASQMDVVTAMRYE